MYVMDWNPTGLCECSIDIADQPFNFLLQVFVLGNVRSARHYHLHERDLMTQISVFLKQQPECAKSLRNTSRIIQAVDAEYQPLARHAVADIRRSGSGFRSFRRSSKFVEVDADRKSSCEDGPSVVPDHLLPGSPLHSYFGQQLLQATREVIAVAIGLETDDVIFEQSTQYGFTPWQFFENIWGRKWNV